MLRTIERVGLKEESNILLPGIANRMSKIPYAEPSEEVRVQLIDLLEVCLKSDKFSFVPHLSAIARMLGHAVADSNPEMKQKAALFAGLLSRELSTQVGIYMQSTVQNLATNLSHQHSKVRKVTLAGMKDVIVARGAEKFVEDALPQLKFSMNDRSADVRAKFYEVLRHWMTNMEI